MHKRTLHFPSIDRKNRTKMILIEHDDHFGLNLVIGK